MENPILVHFTNKCGEYEFTGHVVLDCPEGKEENDIIHNYFMKYYPGMDSECEQKAYSYSYGLGNVAVTKIYCREINHTQAKMLSALGL